MSAARLASQYLVGATSPSGHSTRSHSSGQGSWRWKSRCPGRAGSAAKRDARVPRLPSRQVTVCQATADSDRQGFDRDRLVAGRTPQPRRRPATARPRLGRQRAHARRPDRQVRQNADDIGQLKREQAVLEAHVGAITGVGQHHPRCHALGECGADLLERDLRLGLERHLIRHAGLAPPFRVVGPALGQVEPIGDRQTGLLVGEGERHRHLAVVGLAEDAAVLPRHPDRVLALLGKAGVVDDPGGDRPQRRQDLLAHRGEQVLVGPGGFGNQMMQRLVRGTDLVGAAIGSTLLRSPGRISPRQ